MHELDKTGLEVAKTAYRIAEEHPEMTACTRCAGKGYVHGFGEYGYDPDWCPSCGGPGFELVPGEEDRPLREAISAYLSSTSAGVTEEQTPQFWLAELDPHGNPRLIDGAHEGREGVEKAAYLLMRLGLQKGRTFACAEVHITPVEASPHGANEEALSILSARIQPHER